MKYNIVFKFLAVALCALMLLGAAGSAAAIIGMTESGLYDISVEELRDRYIRSGCLSNLSENSITANIIAAI